MHVPRNTDTFLWVHVPTHPISTLSPTNFVESPVYSPLVSHITIVHPRCPFSQPNVLVRPTNCFFLVLFVHSITEYSQRTRMLNGCCGIPYIHDVSPLFLMLNFSLELKRTLYPWCFFKYFNNKTLTMVKYFFGHLCLFYFNAK